MRMGLSSDSSKALELLSSVNIRSSVPAYVQIENHVQFAIASGHLQPGDKLPSARELADRLQLNQNTIAKAYRDIEVMGLVFTRRGMGVYISEGVEKTCREECRKRLTERIYEVACEARAAGMAKKTFDAIASKSYASGNQPYGEMPAEVAKAGLGA